MTSSVTYLNDIGTSREGNGVTERHDNIMTSLVKLREESSSDTYDKMTSEYQDLITPSKTNEEATIMEREVYVDMMLSDVAKDTIPTTPSTTTTASTTTTTTTTMMTTTTHPLNITDLYRYVTFPTLVSHDITVDYYDVTQNYNDATSEYYNTTLRDYYNVTSFWDPRYPYPSAYTWTRIVLSSVVVTVVMVIIAVGNILVVVAIAVDRHLSGRQNWFIASLAISDLLVGVFIMPLSLANELMGYWVFGDVLCQLWLSTDVLLCTASIFNLVLISVDRYWSITRAISYVRNRTPRRVVSMIAVVWVVSMVICLPPLVGWTRPQPTRFGLPLCVLSEEPGYVVYSVVGSFYLPLIIMILVYAKIYLAARGHARKRLKQYEKVPAVPAAKARKSTSTAKNTTSILGVNNSYKNSNKSNNKNNNKNNNMTNNKSNNKKNNNSRLSLARELSSQFTDSFCPSAAALPVYDKTDKSRAATTHHVMESDVAGSDNDVMISRDDWVSFRNGMVTTTTMASLALSVERFVDDSPVDDDIIAAQSRELSANDLSVKKPSVGMCGNEGGGNGARPQFGMGWTGETLEQLSIANSSRNGIVLPTLPLSSSLSGACPPPPSLSSPVLSTLLSTCECPTSSAMPPLQLGTDTFIIVNPPLHRPHSPPIHSTNTPNISNPAPLLPPQVFLFQNTPEEKEENGGGGRGTGGRRPSISYDLNSLTDSCMSLDDEDRDRALREQFKEVINRRRKFPDFITATTSKLTRNIPEKEAKMYSGKQFLEIPEHYSYRQQHLEIPELYSQCQRPRQIPNHYFYQHPEIHDRNSHCKQQDEHLEISNPYFNRQYLEIPNQFFPHDCIGRAQFPSSNECAEPRLRAASLSLVISNSDDVIRPQGHDQPRLSLPPSSPTALSGSHARQAEHDPCLRALTCAANRRAAIVPDSATDPERTRRRIARAKERRATVVLGIVMVSFIGCWLPFFSIYPISLLAHLEVPDTLFAVIFWLGYANSALNPIIYTIFNRDFRQAFRRLIFGRKKQK